MSRGRHAHRGAAHARRKERSLHRRAHSPVVVFVCAFVLASGTAAFAYVASSGSGTGRAEAVTLNVPGAGSASNPTTTSLSLSWGPSTGLPALGGYLVLRSTSPGGPFSRDSSGSCNQAITLVSTATSCTDTGLTAGTTYYYEIEAGYDVNTLWVSQPDSQFSGTTSGTSPGTPGPVGQAPGTVGTPGPAGSSPVAPGGSVITSASSASFFVGTAGAFQVTASGSPAPTFSNTAFVGCTPSVLPWGITLSDKGLLSGVPGAGTAGTYTVCITADNAGSVIGTQRFSLTIDTENLVISSPAVSGAGSGTPNLGPITVQRQTGSGTPITTGTLTVNLTSSPSSGATFGTAQFASPPMASVTIPSGQNAATFWYGSTSVGKPTITASATGYVSGTQVETITNAPAGLGIALAPGSTGSPAISCGPSAPSDTCNVTGVGTLGHGVVSVVFWDSGNSPVVYSTTQVSTITETGQGAGSVTIGAGSPGSSPQALTVPLGTSTLTFGPYSLTIDVTP
jgi:Putative Ig domain